MEKGKSLDRRSFIISAGGVAIAAGLFEETLRSEPAQLIRRQPVDLTKVNELINQKVADVAMRNELLAISGKMVQLSDPSIIGAWGLGCGAGCTTSTKRFSAMPSAERLSAIQSTRMAREDREILVSLNTSMDKIAMNKGELVGAWGLGCGAGCSRTLQQFGNIAR